MMQGNGGRASLAELYIHCIGWSRIRLIADSPSLLVAQDFQHCHSLISRNGATC